MEFCNIWRYFFSKTGPIAGWFICAICSFVFYFNLNFFCQIISFSMMSIYPEATLGNVSISFCEIPKTRTMGQVQKHSRAESPECLGRARKGQNWENTPRVSYPPLAYHWSCGLVWTPHLSYLSLVGWLRHT